MADLRCCKPFMFSFLVFIILCQCNPAPHTAGCHQFACLLCLCNEQNKGLLTTFFSWGIACRTLLSIVVFLVFRFFFLVVLQQIDLVASRLSTIVCLPVFFPLLSSYYSMSYGVDLSFLLCGTFIRKGNTNGVTIAVETPFLREGASLAEFVT